MKRMSNQMVILLILLLVLSSTGGFTLMSLTSYSTGYQGARAQFHGVRYDDLRYTAGNTQGASRARFDTGLSFDPDEAIYHQPNLLGEMTAIFIPEESLSQTPIWVPTEWQRNIAYIKNPTESYSWSIDNKSYTMEEWTLRWYISISAEWDQGGQWEWKRDLEWYNQRYTDTEIWFQVDLTPVWYFEGQQTAYFAIGKMQVAEVRLHALDNAGNVIEPETDTSVLPESQGSLLPIYYGPFGFDRAERTESTFKGKRLNPDLFTDTVYTYVNLENFGTTTWVVWTPLPNDAYKGAVVTYAIDVTVFVIGEWDVQDIEPIDVIEGDEGYGRTSKVGGGTDWFSIPSNRLLLILIAGLVILLLLAVFAPYTLLILKELFQG